MPEYRDRDGFSGRYASGLPFAVWARMDGDLLTAVAAFMRLRAAKGGPAFLLESVEGGAVRGRYSMIGVAPDLIWRVRDGRAEINRDALARPDAFAPEPDAPLSSLRRLVSETTFELDEGLPPMSVGLFGYLGYDMVRQMERLGRPKPSPIGAPEAIMVRPTAMIVFDNLRDEISIIHTIRPEAGTEEQVAYEAGTALIAELIACLEAPLTISSLPRPSSGIGAPISNMGAGDYEALVARAKDYILAGDIFQVVLSQRFEAPFPLPALALYRSLRRINPAPFLCYLDFEDFQVVCSSPEILVRAREGRVTVRPIAGTRHRGATPAEDARLADELLADPKERAEHLMLLDLGRNDVGRVAELGSVEVTDSFFIERYSQVMHIVSNVEGRLRPDRDVLDALVAGFPAGTVSGAPKVRAMQIIDELEPDGRGPYAGCIGYFGADGQMDTCIVLRTAVVKDGRMYVQAGAGIVHDSDPTSERQECENKARALFRAAEDAVRRAGFGN
jgi:anthranilate synthase component 1